MGDREDRGGDGCDWWIQEGLRGFSGGSFDNGGDNLYASARGALQTIHRTDVNGDGRVDIILPNAHGYVERGPTGIFRRTGAARDASAGPWTRKELPHDSGWMCRIVDLDGDGHPDLVVANGENGVTSELDSYVYWGGPRGLTGERTELPTAGAYDVAVTDIDRDGQLDLIFPSAWVDHHNRGEPRPLTVYRQAAPRRFENASARYGILGVASMSVACGRLTGGAHPDLVVANYRSGFDGRTDSFLYPGAPDGFQTDRPIRLPTHHALQVLTGDLDGDGREEIVFCGGNEVRIFWNRGGRFSPRDVTVLEAAGVTTLFCAGAVHAAIADVDGDGAPELVLAMEDGVQIRRRGALDEVQAFLPLPHAVWVAVADVDGDGRPDIAASRYCGPKAYEAESAVFWNGPQGFRPDRITRFPTAGAMGCAAGDLDGDGRAEVVFQSTMQGPTTFDPDFPAYVYLGLGGGRFGPAARIEIPTGGWSNSYVLADLDQDGRPELVLAAADGLRIFPCGPEGPRPDRYRVLAPRRKDIYFYNAYVADFNRDGWLDLCAAAYTYDAEPGTMASSSVIFFGSERGFSAENSVVVPTFCCGLLHLADLDNDGWLDLIYPDKRGYLVVYRGGPSGYSQDRTWKVPLPGTDKAFVGTINSADIDGDGRLELVVGVMGHYFRRPSGFFLLRAGPDGIRERDIEWHGTEATNLRISLADVDRDGFLDLLVPSYSTQFSRTLPAHVFRGNGKSFDFANPLNLPCDSSCAFTAVDLTGNGYPDLLAVCHRNDAGHQVDSLLFYNGPDGLDLERPLRIPGMGPHGATTRDFGNGRTREPLERYVSVPLRLEGRRPAELHWDADVPEGTGLTFQLRWARDGEDLEAQPWRGPAGAGTSFARSGLAVAGCPHGAALLQYRAAFHSSNGCASPLLRKVAVRLERA